MILRKLYVADTCSLEGSVAAYILWDADVPITLRFSKPESLDILEMFNAEPEPDACPGELFFSRFTTPGYLGLIFSMHHGTTVPVIVTIRITAEDGSGLSEVYEKQIMLHSPGENDTPPLNRVHSPNGKQAKFSGSGKRFCIR
jgi:hypothetical protein